MEKKLKITLCIVAITLVSVIAFAGVYVKDTLSYKDALPEYTLDSELKGKRISYFKVSDATEEKIYDKDGKEVKEIPEGANEADYKKETVKVNSDESLNEENFILAKKIFENRLKETKADDYLIRLDKASGNIVVELPDNESTDIFLQYLLFKGDFSLTDKENETELLNRKDVLNSTIDYKSNNKTKEVTVYLNINLNEDGTKKLAEISKNYLKSETESEATDTNNDEKMINVVVEGTTIKSMNFDSEVNDGVLRIEIGTGKDNNTVYSYANQAGFIAYIINNGEVPIKYTVGTSETINSELAENALCVLIKALIGITGLMIVYMIIKYKSDGFYAGLSFISGIAILLLLLRYTKTVISLGGFVAIAVLLAVEAYFIFNILNSIKKDSSIDNTKFACVKTYLKKIDIIIVLLIVAVIFTFMKEVKAYSIGMTLFYGIISLAFANLVFLRTLLIENHK